MKTQPALRASLLAAALLFGAGAGAQTTTAPATTTPPPMTPPMTMSNADYSAAKDRIEADHKAARATCDRLSGNAKDICQAEAKGQEKIALADLQYRRSGKPADHEKVELAKADASYEVAKERCDDKAGNDKDVCIKDAKAMEARAKANAKAVHGSAEKRSDASRDARDAEYKAAVERCDSLAGDAKSACVNAAKARFGKG